MFWGGGGGGRTHIRDKEKSKKIYSPEELSPPTSVSLAASDSQLHKRVSIFLLNSALEDQKYRKKFSTYTSKLSFITVTSITGDTSPFHNFKSKFNLGFNFVISMTIQNRNVCLINLIQGIYSVIHHD